MLNASLSLYRISDIPIIKPGDALAEIIHRAMQRSGEHCRTDDIIAIAQKIVSKAEGRIVDLNEITPSGRARSLAEETGKDARLVELILSEAKEVIRYKPGVIIVEHRCGVILANAGIDHSNVGNAADRELVTLLPQDPNTSAKRIRAGLQALSGKRTGVIITDSIGRPWRMGTVGVAIGSAGIIPLRDLRGRKDLFGETLRVSETADIDALASAACMLMGEADDGSPVILIRGHQPGQTDEAADRLLRPRDDDMFR
ncbi:MAG: coenzyme F420-0:L-glutamate ligase [Gammaproteobacteria bacterium]